MEVEKDAEVARFLKTVQAEKRVDLEAWEFALRRVILAAGARMLETVLQGLGCGRRVEPVRCGCGDLMRSVGRREKTIRTILGPVRLRRSLFLCERCGSSCFPADRLLGVERTSFSPGLRRLMARAGSRTSFGEAEDDLRVYAELKVGRKEVERVAEQVGREIEHWSRPQREQAIREARQPSCASRTKDIPMLYVSFDGTGVPMRRQELAGRKGRSPDGEAKTREVKLGCVFTQTALDEEGRPVRDPASTTYVGAIEISEAFGWRIYAEALRRGLDRARHLVLLTDGARYNKTIMELHFPDATHIIDLYHAREHVHALSVLLLTEQKRKTRESKWLKLLDAGQVERLVAHVRRHLPRSGKRRQEALTEIRYFEDNAQHMRYADFRAKGFFVGSGVIEAGCRTVIGERLKKAGMFWSVRGANAIIAARCCQFSGRFEQFWEDQVA